MTTLLQNISVKYTIIITIPLIKDVYMTRYIPQWLAPIVESLELNRPELVTMDELRAIADAVGIETPGYVIADRLRKLGWLLETPQRGVWEFAPAENAGPYSASDPLLPMKAFMLAHPGLDIAMTFQTAAWALGIADRVPARTELAFAQRPTVKIPDEISPSVFNSDIGTVEAKGVPCLQPESIVVHMAQRPCAVRSWQGALEWLPDITYEMDVELVLAELENRPSSVWARTGYLLSGMRPDIAERIGEGFDPRSKARFGPRASALRNDERWKVSDTLLPFDPREFEVVN